MKLFEKKDPPKRVRKEDAIMYLSEKFNIPAADMRYEFEEGVKGWRNGKEEYADTLRITVKQPLDRPNLHHDMQQELTQVFRAQYGTFAFNPKNMKFYFGVHEDKDHTAQLLRERPKPEEPLNLPMPTSEAL